MALTSDNGTSSWLWHKSAPADPGMEPTKTGTSSIRSWTALGCSSPVMRLIGEYERSVNEFPNIKPGEDFKGYGKKEEIRDPWNVRFWPQANIPICRI